MNYLGPLDLSLYESELINRPSAWASGWLISGFPDSVWADLAVLHITSNPGFVYNAPRIPLFMNRGHYLAAGNGAVFGFSDSIYFNVFENSHYFPSKYLITLRDSSLRTALKTRFINMERP